MTAILVVPAGVYGEPMREIANAPAGYVKVRGPMHREEALVVQGLMEASDIPSEIVMVSADASAYTRQPASYLSLYVVEDRAEEAAALLSQAPVADAGDTGTE